MDWNGEPAITRQSHHSAATTTAARPTITISDTRGTWTSPSRWERSLRCSTARSRPATPCRLGAAVESFWRQADRYRLTADLLRQQDGRGWAPSSPLRGQNRRPGGWARPRAVVPSGRGASSRLPLLQSTWCCIARAALADRWARRQITIGRRIPTNRRRGGARRIADLAARSIAETTTNDELVP